ncbi:type III secretion system inner membrane ring subunit SctD [Paraburkholderia sediminicola]|uniref:type III secretion system inner membrane ring subunit SctD n=1 Tax=Paraburkholderia sediminicola TaxID=458836 RepID=UPI0038BD9699
MSSHFKLKLLNGPLRKREVHLPTGEWRIGGEQSDFAVKLDGGHEAILRITDETGIELLGTAPYWIAGKRRSYPSGPLPLRVPIDIDGLVVMIGQASESLPDVKVPGRASPRRPAIVMFGFAMTALVGAGITVTAILTTPPNFQPVPVGAKALSAVLPKELQVEGVNVSFQGQAVVLSGTCTDRSTLSRSVDSLVRKGVTVIDDVVCEDDLVRSVASVLQLYGLTGAKVLPGTRTGYVEIVGRVGDDPHWSQIAEALGKIPGLKGWRIEDAGAGVIQQLTAGLRSAGILDDLSVFRSGDVVLVNGLLDPKQQTTVRTIIADFTKVHPAGPRVIYQDIAPDVPSAKIFPSPLTSIGGDPDHAFAVLQNGQRFAVGDTLPSGFRIDAIHSDGVDVEHDGDFVHVPVITRG